MEALYDNLNRKIDNLINKQIRKLGNHQPNQHQRFYQCTINLTNIRFTKEEQTEFPLRLDNGRSPHAYVNQRLQIEFRAPDDERNAARNTLSFQ
jgi:hypothetical protein